MVFAYPDAIKKRILTKVENIAPVLEMLPGVAIVNDVRDGTVIYMSGKGLEVLGVTLEELQAMGNEYHQRFFNMLQAEEYVPLVLEMMQRADPDETCTFFQQVKFKKESEWQWHLTAMRILETDDDGKPVAILCIAQHLAAEHHYNRKIERLTGELTFLKKNIKQFESLGKREREILKLMAEGNSSLQIAGKLYISEHTANTHRKNIRRKLGVNNSRDIDHFARAFDLV